MGESQSGVSASLLTPTPTLSPSSQAGKLILKITTGGNPGLGPSQLWQLFREEREERRGEGRRWRGRRARPLPTTKHPSPLQRSQEREGQGPWSALEGTNTAQLRGQPRPRDKTRDISSRTGENHGPGAAASAWRVCSLYHRAGICKHTYTYRCS